MCYSLGRGFGERKGMSRQIPAALKTLLSEELANWFRLFGEVPPRRSYRDDETGNGGDATARPPFIEHPWLAELPDGAPSDLSAVATENSYVEEEANRRSDELANELQQRLTVQNKHQKKFLYEYHTKPQPF